MPFTRYKYDALCESLEDTFTKYIKLPKMAKGKPLQDAVDQSEITSGALGKMYERKRSTLQRMFLAKCLVAK